MRNRALCLTCMQVIESRSVHDYQSCECGNALDGGNEYRRVLGDFDNLLFLDDDEIPLYPVNNKGKKSIGRKETDLPRSLGKAIKRKIAQKAAQFAIEQLKNQIIQEAEKERKDLADRYSSWVSGVK